MTNTNGHTSGTTNREPIDLSNNDELYLRWARDIGFNQEIKLPSDDPRKKNEYIPPMRDQIDDWFRENYVPVLDALWTKYVPKRGSCTVLQGELARYIGRLETEYFRNGMMNMGEGIFDKMVDNIKEEILKDCNFSPLVVEVLKMDTTVVLESNYDEIMTTFSPLRPTSVQTSLNRLKMVVAAWCIAHPEPIAFTPN